MTGIYKSPAITITEAIETDIPKILDIQTECFLSIWTAEEYLEEIYRKDSLVLSAKYEGKTIGFMTVRLASTNNRLADEPAKYDELDILNFGIFKKYRKLGIGSLLFEKLLNKTAVIGLETIWLEVRESNFDAISFYNKKGFRKVQIRKNFYRQPLENAIVMKLELQDICPKTLNKT